MSDKIICKYTDNKKLSSQYLRVRKIVNYMDYGKIAPEFFDYKDHYDDAGDVFVVQSEGRCVGGARLNVIGYNKSNFLPCEHDDFILGECLPRLNLFNVRYGEISGFTILPQYRSLSVYENMFEQICRRARMQGLSFLFFIADKQSFRQIMHICKKLKLDTSDVRSLYSYNGIDNLGDDFLVIINLEKKIKSDVSTDTAKAKFSLHSIK